MADPSGPVNGAFPPQWVSLVRAQAHKKGHINMLKMCRLNTNTEAKKCAMGEIFRPQACCKPI